MLIMGTITMQETNLKLAIEKLEKALKSAGAEIEISEAKASAPRIRKAKSDTGDKGWGNAKRYLSELKTLGKAGSEKEARTYLATDAGKAWLKTKEAKPAGTK